MSLSIAEFFDRLRDSEVLPLSEIDALWQEIPAFKRKDVAERHTPSLVESGKLTHYQAAALIAGKGHTLVLGDYVILHQIGAGGMGQVFKARHRRMKRTVAVKVLPPAVTDNPDAIRRFQREVEAAARLTHPNIVTAHDAGEQKGIHYLVIEYVEGEDLSNVVRKYGPLSVEMAIDYVMQAAIGLSYAHREGIIHRDIKPANLLLDSTGVVKILDMGLARFDRLDTLDAADSLTRTGAMMGTPDYIAPEQSEDTKHVDARADIYSLGCTLFYLLTGRAMYVGNSDIARVLAHHKEPIPSLAALRPDLPAIVSEVFAHMVAKRPEHRIQNMEEVQNAIAACQQALIARLLPARSQPILGVPFAIPLGYYISGAPSSYPSVVPMAVPLSAPPVVAVYQGEVPAGVEPGATYENTEAAPVEPTRPQMARPVEKARRQLSRKHLIYCSSGAVLAAILLLAALSFLDGLSCSSDIRGPSIGKSFTGREEGMKAVLLEKYGGNESTEAAVKKALEWLKKNQEKDGTWSLVGPYGNGTQFENKTAATAMALLAFQGAGNTHKRGEFQKEVAKGWSAFRKMQDKDGAFQFDGIHNHRLYAQAQATIAICDLYGMTKDNDYKQAAQSAIDYAVKAQSPTGGWRYMPGQDADTSVTGWFVMALQSGLMAGLEVPSPTLDKINKYLDSVALKGGTRYTYRPGGEETPTMTADALLCRQYLGWAQNDPRLANGVNYVNANPIDWSAQNVYYWYYATQATHHLEGEYWNKWNAVMRQTLPEHQEQTGKEAGSWSPANDRWGDHGGRLFTTCLCTYMLEVYYRHLPVYTNRVQR